MSISPAPESAYIAFYLDSEGWIQPPASYQNQLPPYRRSTKPFLLHTVHDHEQIVRTHTWFQQRTQSVTVYHLQAW